MSEKRVKRFTPRRLIRSDTHSLRPQTLWGRLVAERAGDEMRYFTAIYEIMKTWARTNAISQPQRIIMFCAAGGEQRPARRFPKTNATDDRRPVVRSYAKTAVLKKHSTGF